MPVRIQRSRQAGTRMPPDTIIVDRSTEWGNPYVGTGPADRALVVERYRDYMLRPEQAAARERVKSNLRGKNLACWCPLDQPCHADVLLEIANG